MIKRRAVLLSLAMPVLALAIAFLATPVLATSMLPANSYGYDISYPDTSYPGTTFGGQTLKFGIVGVTGGKAFTQNSKLSAEYNSVVTVNHLAASFYMNLNYPVGTTASNGMTGPKGNCSNGDKACQAYNYGYNASANAFGYASTTIGAGAAASGPWWLDIETANSWSGKTSLNDTVIQGALDYFKGSNIAIGIYSSPSMWRSIAGSWAPGVPEWFAGPSGVDPSKLPGYCNTAANFTGGAVAVVQSYNSSFGHDLDYACQ